MTQQARPYVWQMCKEAVECLGGKASYREIKDYIHKKYTDVNDNTITSQIIVCTVNHKSRVHYPENSKPRVCDSQYDFLYSTGRGQVVLYDPEKHGLWAIVEKNGKLSVEQVGLEETEEEIDREALPAAIFSLESHLRDFLSKNLETIEMGLRLFEDENGRDGVEYPTEVGPIDILAIDSKENFVVFELKVSRGADKACGQLLRYMGWVRRNLAKGKEVRGVILAEHIDDKLKYAASECSNVRLLEYRISFNINKVDLE